MLLGRLLCDAAYGQTLRRRRILQARGNESEWYPDNEGMTR